MKVLFFGPVPPPFHGQSIAFEKALEVDIDEKEVIDINLTGASRFKKIYLSFVILTKLFYLLFLKKKPDVIYFTCSRTISGSLRDVVLLSFAKFLSIPVINHLHGANFKSFFNGVPGFYRRILWSAYQAVKVNIVLTASMKDQFEMFSHIPVLVVKNFYDNDIGFSSSCEYLQNSSNSEINLVFLSNIMQTKGIFVLLDAFDVISEKYPHITLKIAGSIIGDRELCAEETKKKFFNQVGGNKSIEYVGVVKGKQKADMLKSASIFVLPTYYESEAVPLSIIEAMASGCAVITTKHNYLPDLVGQENGLLIEVKNVKDLVLAIERYIKDESLLLKHQMININHAREFYSEDQYKHAIKSILKKVYSQFKAMKP